MCNREISSRRIDWCFPRSSTTTIRGRSPGGVVPTPPPPDRPRYEKCPDRARVKQPHSSCGLDNYNVIDPRSEASTNSSMNSHSPQKQPCRMTSGSAETDLFFHSIILTRGQWILHLRPCSKKFYCMAEPRPLKIQAFKQPHSSCCLDNYNDIDPRSEASTNSSMNSHSPQKQPCNCRMTSGSAETDLFLHFKILTRGQWILHLQ